MNKFFHTWRKQLHVITSGEIGEQSFGYTGLIFFAHEYLCQILSIEMPSFDCLEDVYIIFIQQMRYKNSHKQRLHK